MLHDGWHLSLGVLLAVVLALAATNLARGEWGLALVGVCLAVAVRRVMEWNSDR